MPRGDTAAFAMISAQTLEAGTSAGMCTSGQGILPRRPGETLPKAGGTGAGAHQLCPRAVAAVNVAPLGYPSEAVERVSQYQTW